eukprot:scaffold13025_cov19-Tisochrysis_lutea.AAC.1
MPQLLWEASPWLRSIIIFRDPVERYTSAFYYYRLVAAFVSRVGRGWGDRIKAVVSAPQQDPQSSLLNQTFQLTVQAGGHFLFQNLSLPAPEPYVSLGLGRYTRECPRHGSDQPHKERMKLHSRKQTCKKQLRSPSGQ